MWKLPEKTDYMKIQNDHQATLDYARQIHEAVLKYKPDYKNALEIGCAWGVSTLAIMTAGNGYLTSVDVNYQTKANAEVEANDLQSRWIFEHSDSKDFWTLNKNTYDLIYVDGSHKYPACKLDLFGAYDALEPGGILMLDDYTHHKNQVVDADGISVEYGVSYAVCELIAHRPISKVEGFKNVMVIWK